MKAVLEVFLQSEMSSCFHSQLLKYCCEAQPTPLAYLLHMKGFADKAIIHNIHVWLTFQIKANCQTLYLLLDCY